MTAGAPPLGPPLLLRVYIAVLAVAAVAVGVGLRSMTVEAPGDAPLWVLPLLAALLVAAGYMIVRFRYRGEVNGLNLVEAALAPLLVAFDPPIVVATVAVAQIGDAILRRNPPLKATFNTAQWVLAAAAGSLTFNALAVESDSALTMAAVLVALAAVALVNQVLFTLVVAFANRQRLLRVLPGLAPVVIPGWLVGWAVNSLIGLLFVLAMASQPLAVLLFPVPLVVLHLAYRGYAGARSDRMRLTGLHRAAQALATPLDPRSGIDGYLREVVTAFEARAATLVLRDGEHRLVHDVDAVTGAVTVRREDADIRSLEGELLHAGEAMRITVGRGHSLGAMLGQRGWRDCLAAPLVDDGEVIGAVLVLDQAGLEGFEAGELAVLEALARETAATLAKGRLLTATLDERRKLAEIVGTASDGIMTLGPDGTVRSWNPALERITGVPLLEALAAPSSSAVLELSDEAGRPVSLDDWASGRAMPTDLLIRSRTGEVRRLTCSYSRTDDGTDATLVVIARDVTPEQEIEELRERYGRLAEAEAAQRAVVDELQHAIRPQRPDVPGTELALCYLPSDPSSPTGGDLYDWQMLPTGEVHLAVVDVLGHGVGATKDALVVIQTLRLLALQGCPLDELVTRADVLIGAQDPDTVATVVVARYDASNGRLRLAAGGHPPALLVRRDGVVMQLPAPGCAIGWPTAGSETVVEVTLAPEDALVLYTDGLVESRKDILEGMEVLIQHAAALAHLPAEQLAVQLVEQSLEGAARRDDSLALVLRRAPVTAEPVRATWQFPPDAARLRDVRGELRGWLVAVGVEPTQIDDVLVVASELMTNAVRAGRTSVSVVVAITDGRLVLEVEDDGSGDPALADAQLSEPDVDAERGRGLFIVRALMDDVRVLSTAEGTSIRCTAPVTTTRTQSAAPVEP